MNYETKLNYVVKLVTIKKDYEQAINKLNEIIFDDGIDEFPHFKAQALVMTLEICFAAESYDDCKEIIELYRAIEFKDTELDLYEEFSVTIDSIASQLPQSS